MPWLTLLGMARPRAKSRRPSPSSRPRAPRLPVTKRIVTKTEKVQFGRVGFGNVDVDALIDQAFVAADDGDCSRVAKTLDRAEAAGGNVGLHRKQLMQDCTLDRAGLAFAPSDALGKQSDWINWRTALIGVGALWLGSKVF